VREENNRVAKMASADFAEKEIDELRKVFSKFDINGDDNIDAHELAAALKESGVSAPAPSEIAAMIKQVDTDHSGTIEWHEFLLACDTVFVLCGKLWLTHWCRWLAASRRARLAASLARWCTGS
jgi:Ca2+-binding EF-hand superfamily protein